MHTHTHTDSKHFESSSCGMLQSPSDTLENWMVPLPGCCFQLKVKFSLFEFRPPRHASAPSPASQTVNLPQLQRDCKNISLIGGLIAFMQFTFSIVTYHDFEFNLRAKTVFPCWFAMSIHNRHLWHCSYSCAGSRDMIADFLSIGQGFLKGTLSQSDLRCI